MAQLSLWLWRFAMVAGAVTVGFFAWMAVAPFDTVGDPSFDAVIIRSRLWENGGFFLVQLAGVGLWLLVAISVGAWGRAIKAIAAGLLLFACLIAMASEYDSLIQYGDLRDPKVVADHKLMVSRALTLGLSLASLAAGWWARARP